VTFVGHELWINQLEMHHSGRYFYSVSDDKSINIWDLHSGGIRQTIEKAHSHFVSTIASSDKYYQVVTGSVDKIVQIWDC